MNAAVAAPAATGTLAGTVSAALLLVSVTVIALAAALLSVTVQLDVCPDRMLPGVHATALNTAGADSVSVKLFDPPVAVAAVSSAVSSALTAAAVTVKAAVVAEAATGTLAGTAALALPLVSVTVMPPAGAAADIVTVQLAVPGAFTVAGAQLNVLTTGSGVTVTDAVLVIPPAAAVTVAV